ncbi:MAG: hypothetical protein ACXQTK_03120 [Candidatus Syntropharchaeales archaeon]
MRLLIASLVFLAALISLFAKWMVWLTISIYLFYTSGISPAIAFLIMVLIFIDVAPEFFIRPLLLLAFIGGGIMESLWDLRTSTLRLKSKIKKEEGD